MRLRRDNRICSENTRKTVKFHNVGFIENQETRRDRDHRKSKLRACNPAGVGGRRRLGLSALAGGASQGACGVQVAEAQARRRLGVTARELFDAWMSNLTFGCK